MSADSNSKRTPHYINTNVAFVKQDRLIQECVQEMIDKNISSLLVEDELQQIIGIVTERDIVRKFTLLELGDKLTRTIGTIMTRPVEFVQLKDYHKQIVKLHLERRIRHFPILSAAEPTKENLVGIVSITDIARNYMVSDAKKIKDEGSSSQSQSKSKLGVLASQRSLVNTYIEIFNQLGFATSEVLDIARFIQEKPTITQVLIMDLDGFSEQKLHEILPLVVRSNFYLVLTTSQPALVPTFKKYLNHDRQEIAMKPLDISYISWLLQSKWNLSTAAS